MSWQNQARDSKGRFLPKTVAPTPPRVTRRRKKENVKQFNVFVIDDSGSIRHNNMVNSIINGMNEIIHNVENSNSDNKIEMFWGLSLFGTAYNNQYSFSNSPIKLVYYNPSQSATALYDGIGYALAQTEHYIANKNIKTNNVVVTIFTDGQENDSRKFTKEKVKTLIEAYKEKGWMINFVGGGDEVSVKKVAESIGIFEQNTMNYNTDSKDTTRAFNKMSKAMSNYTSSVAEGNSSNIGFFGN